MNARCARSMAERILDAFPSGVYAMGTLLRLLDVVETDRIPSAAVECSALPRLLVNPDFVDRHAPTSEKLFILVMHELHHVILGHTRLMRRVTAADNLVFDAVINALLCRMFPEEEFTSFFTDFYDDGEFPQCLLRPVRNWNPRVKTRIPRGLKKKGFAAAAEVYRSLYSEAGATYEELYDALRGALDEERAAGVFLVGSHDPAAGAARGSPLGREAGAETEEQAGKDPEAGTEAGLPDYERLPSASPVLFEAVRRIVEKWPLPPNPIRGRSLSDIMETVKIRVRRRRSNRAILRGLFRRLAERDGAKGPVRVLRERPVMIETPLPVMDRRGVVLRALGASPLLHQGRLRVRRLRRSGGKVHVYIDVSGSIGDFVGPLYGAILDAAEWIHRPVHLFSTEVRDISLSDLRRGRVETTYGTDIVCVAGHMAGNEVRRAVIVTDGYVGRPQGSVKEILEKVKIGVALVPGGSSREDLKDVADHWASMIDFSKEGGAS